MPPHGERGKSISALHRLGLPDVVAICTNYGVWMFPDWRLRRTRWQLFERVFTDGHVEQRFIREVVFGQRRGVRYYAITTDPVYLPLETMCDLMPTRSDTIERTVANTYELRTWIAYGFKETKDGLGWADCLLYSAVSIERWWELVLCVYLFMSLQAPSLPHQRPTLHVSSCALSTASALPPAPLQHLAWTSDASRKHRLDHLRLLWQPFICACLLSPWLRLYPVPHLTAGLADLCALVPS